jgi:hypothetical protein
MIYNPFDLVTPRFPTKQAETLKSETIRNSPFGVPLKNIGDVEEERDTGTLCGSKHFVETWVSLGAVDEDTATQVGTLAEEKEFIVPGQSNIIVGFSPQDTSGGGKVQKWFEDYIMTPLINTGKVIVGSGQVIGIFLGDFFSNPLNWVSNEETQRETADAIIDAVPQDSMTGGVLSEVGCSVPLVNLASYCRAGSDSGSKGVLNRIWNWEWNAEEFKNETGVRTEESYETYFGTNYHNANAGAHKILVEITLERPDGTVVEKHAKYVAGSPEVYEEGGDLYQKPGIGVFAIDEPGTWRVNLSPVAWGTCSNVEWSESYTVEVAKPEWWDAQLETAQEQEIETLTTQANLKLQELGLPGDLTVLTFAGLAIAGVALGSYLIIRR